MGLLDLLGPIGSIAESVIGLFDDDDPKKVEAQAKLIEIQNQLSLVKIQANKDVALARAQIVTAEAQSEHWLTSMWRPIVMLTFAAIIVYSSVFVSMFGLKPVDLAGVPDKFWQLLLLGVGGYVFLRSGEKIAKTGAAAFANRKNNHATEEG
jgi:hypothetical protein